MNINTGEIVDEAVVKALPAEERKNFTPLTRKQARYLKKLEKKDRVQWYKDQKRHKDKQIEKRRAANKRRNYNRRLNGK